MPTEHTENTELDTTSMRVANGLTKHQTHEKDFNLELWKAGKIPDHSEVGIAEEWLGFLISSFPH